MKERLDREDHERARKKRKSSAPFVSFALFRVIRVPNSFAPFRFLHGSIPRCRPAEAFHEFLTITRMSADRR